MKRRGFTIIEMLVAIGLLTALLAGSAVIFSVSVQAQRTAKATSEISRRLRAITDQLNADFARLQKDAPLAIWFEPEFVRIGPGPNDWIIKNRYDQILFFAVGDVQTTHQYDNGTVNGTISGNVARIYYGQAHEIDYATRNIKQIYRNIENENENPPINIKGAKLLARRQHVLTGDEGLEDFANSFLPTDNDFFEYDTMSLVGWEGLFNNSDHRDQFLSMCFDNGIDPINGQPTGISGRPGIDFNEGQTMHLLMSEEVGSFAVDLGYIDRWGRLQWLPESLWVDMNSGGWNKYPSGFGLGFNLNLPPGFAGVWNERWGRGEDFVRFMPGPPIQENFPQALKFTFTLYDSLGIYEDGKRFTHIVYLDD